MITLPQVVTCGDPTGVGLDILLRLWAHRQDQPLSPFYLLAHPDHAQAMAQCLGLKISVRCLKTPQEALAIFQEALPVFPLPGPGALTIGTPSPKYAEITILALKTAAQHLRSGLARSLMTLPLHKASLYQAGFTAMGHTDYLANLCGLSPDDVVMMLDAPSMRVVPLTIHMPLASVPRAVTAERLSKTLTILVNHMTIDHPRIAICGLNPHAGEDGHLGTEEQTIIIPTLKSLRHTLAAHLDGPLPADTIFQDLNRYDVIVGMYHDQVLGPIKALDFWNTVNVTLGLPFLRTSPDHGTAHTLAGQGTADTRSVFRALRYGY